MISHLFQRLVVSHVVSPADPSRYDLCRKPRDSEGNHRHGPSHRPNPSFPGKVMKTRAMKGQWRMWNINLCQTVHSMNLLMFARKIHSENILASVLGNYINLSCLLALNLPIYSLFFQQPSKIFPGRKVSVIEKIHIQDASSSTSPLTTLSFQQPEAQFDTPSRGGNRKRLPANGI